ncbi:hypothetical protein KQX54_005267 [Cotesia glomerata]|uniref:Uncharacterized protein n=1 Tax=Cotesia glomerata TaxID=32391 RepID=A0AAV7I599_COTGL|nr:hypothetical protein KQX54_005267 [Cotesia glomerata]
MDVWVSVGLGHHGGGRVDGGQGQTRLKTKPETKKRKVLFDRETRRLLTSTEKERKKERFYLLASYLSLSVVALASALGQSQVSVPQYQSAPSAYIIVLLAAQSSLAQVKLAGPLGHCLSCVVNHILFPRFSLRWYGVRPPSIDMCFLGVTPTREHRPRLAAPRDSRRELQTRANII